MAMTSLKEIMGEFQGNPEFRKAFTEDAIQACKKFGYEVSAEDLATIQSALHLKQRDSAEKDEELQKRNAP